MGAISSKQIQLSKVTTKMLNVKTKVNRSHILTPRLCSVILRQNGLGVKCCCQNDLIKLKHFLQRDSNLQSECKKRTRNLDFEIAKQLRKLAYHKSEVILSDACHRHLNNILSATKTDQLFFSRPKLVSKIIIPELEMLQCLHLSNRHKNIFLDLILQLRTFFQYKISVQDLRKYPKGMDTNPGLERAHKFSLFLAVNLWKHIYGHQYISAKDRQALKNALANPSNLYYTCKYTNRVLHVKYDNEIVSALGHLHTADISSGAQLRVLQILFTIEQIKFQPCGLKKGFWSECVKTLKPLSA